MSSSISAGPYERLAAPCPPPALKRSGAKRPPRWPASAAAATAAVRTKGTAADRAWSVLLAEDNVLVAEITRARLEKVNAVVHHAADGRAALQMALAIQPETPIRKLVLNDVGPVITAVSLERIGMYLGRAPRC
mgnify:CR=1 FL=1